MLASGFAIPATVLKSVALQAFSERKRMRSLRIVVYCLGGFLLGAAPVLLIALWSDRIEQLAAIAAIVGLIGVGIFGGAAFYGVSIRSSLARVFRVTLWVFLEHNAKSGYIVPLDDPRDIGLQLPEEFDERLGPRLRRGAVIGAWVGVVIAFFAIPYVPSGRDEDIVARIAGPIAFELLGGLFGALYFAAGFAMTVPGRHRIVLPFGCIVAGLVGALVSAAVTIGAPARERAVGGTTYIVTFVFASIGLFFAMCSPEAGLSNADESQDDD
jgi:hypothetical protein